MAKMRMALPSRQQGRAGTHYFVQPMIRDGRRIVPGRGHEVADEDQAKRFVDSLARRSVGVIAYEVELDIDGEAITEPAIIVTRGMVAGILSQELGDD